MAGVTQNISQQHAGTNRIATLIVIRKFRCRTMNYFMGRRQEFGIFMLIQIFSLPFQRSLQLWRE
jgi:hypothetical protein